MTHREVNAACALALLAAFWAPCTRAAAPPGPGLTVANYVEAADTLVDTLNTSTVAFTTMMLGRVGDEGPSLRSTSFSAPATPPMTEAFDTPCPGGGSVSGRVSDADESGDLSVHDRFVTVFKACKVGTEVISGSSEFTVTAHRVDNKGETVELAFRFHHLGSASMRWNGAATAMLRTDDKTGATHYAVTYRDLVVDRGAHTYRWRFTLDEVIPPIGDHVARIDGTMHYDNAPLRLVQDDAFVLSPAGLPRSGRITAIDADRDRLRIEAVPGRYRYRLFLKTNLTDTPDSASESQPHAAR